MQERGTLLSLPLGFILSLLFIYPPRLPRPGRPLSLRGRYDPERCAF